MGSPAFQPRHPNESWVLDIIRTTGSSYMLAAVDVFTRQCIAHEVRTTFNANDVVRLLDRAVAAHGAPMSLLMHQGSIFADIAIHRWATHHGAQIVYPRAPFAKGQIERIFRALVADRSKIPGLRKREYDGSL